MHLHNIATGSVATEEMAEDILNAKSRGEESLVKYLKERLKDKSISFWDPLPKLKLKTFEDALKSQPKGRKDYII